MTTSGSHVAIPGNTVISAMASTIRPKNGSDAQATATAELAFFFAGLDLA